MPDPVWLTEAELRERYGDAHIDELADRDRDNIPDEGVVAAAIVDAEGRAESKLLIRYDESDFPATAEAASPKLKRLVAQLANVYLARGFYPNPPDWVDKLETATLAELDEVGKGGAALSLAGSPSVDIARGQVSVAKRSTSLSEQPLSLAALESWGR